MVKQRSRKPGLKAPPRVQDLSAGLRADAGALDDGRPEEAHDGESAEDTAANGEGSDAIDEASAVEMDAAGGTKPPVLGVATGDDAAERPAGPGGADEPSDATGGDATSQPNVDLPWTTGADPATEEPAELSRETGAAEVTDLSRETGAEDATELSRETDAEEATDLSREAGAEEVTELSRETDAEEATGGSGGADAAVEPSADPAGADDEVQAGEPDADDPLAAMIAGFDAARPATPAGVKLSEELPIDPEDDLRQVEGEASPRLVSIIESLLFAAAKPLRVQDLRKVLAETSKHQIQLALKHLLAITRERGVVLAQVAGGFQYRTHPDNAVWVQKMLQAKPARLSRTQIETLAIVAYRQPITRPEIDDVRGVDSGAVLKSLLERDLIQIVGRKEEPGRPLLYGTTVRFLEFFNLRSLRDLPTLRDFRDLSEESKATLRARLGPNESEALGQGVLGLDTPGEEAGAEQVLSEETETAVDGEPIDPESASTEEANAAADGASSDAERTDAVTTDEGRAEPADDATPEDGTAVEGSAASTAEESEAASTEVEASAVSTDEEGAASTAEATAVEGGTTPPEVEREEATAVEGDAARVDERPADGAGVESTVGETSGERADGEPASLPASDAGREVTQGDARALAPSAADPDGAALVVPEVVLATDGGGMGEAVTRTPATEHVAPRHVGLHEPEDRQDAASTDTASAGTPAQESDGPAAAEDHAAMPLRNEDDGD